MTNILRATLTALLLSIALPACGPPSLPGAEARYKSNQDRLSAIVTRKPTSKAEIDGKVAEFKAEYDKAMKEGTDEQKIAALSALSSRMDKYIDMLEPPKDTKAGGAAAPSDKLDSKTPATAPVTTPTAPGKLDGGATPPSSGGMGTAPTPTPTPTPTTPTTVTPTPAPAPTPAAPSGGMGGM
jgi:hypothetical protein